MAAKAQAVAEEAPPPAKDPGADATGLLCYIALPEPVYEAINREATTRGQTVAQFLATAITNELLRTKQPRSPG